MVSLLYPVSAFTYAFVLLIILIHDIRVHKNINNVERAFRILLVWVIFFCLQDVFWGIAGSSVTKGNEILFVASSIFHLSTITTTVFWLNYVLFYLNSSKKVMRIFLILDFVVVFSQFVLVVVNLFYPVLFTIEDHIYIPASLRVLAFLNQYLFYLVVGAVTLGFSFFAKDDVKRHYFNVFLFTIGPIASGIFQLLYPNGPFYSLGYFISCFIIHMFVVSSDRSELEKVKRDQDIMIEKQRANTDGLTGLLNRRAFEEDQQVYPAIPPEADFAFFSVDVNGLKTVNDSMGHEAGDELLLGTAKCLNQALGAYGRVYRIGGDEFAAIVFASKSQLELMMHDLREISTKYKGKYINTIALSIGCATKAEFPTETVKEIMQEADDRMYKDKADYYSKNGIDRRRQQSAFNALCETYAKILKVNLTKDAYLIIRMDELEKDNKKGFSAQISSWLYNFGMSGQVYAEDLEAYLKHVDIEFLREFFREGNKSLSVFYRRKYENAYRMTKMEMIPAEDYTLDNQTIYLYVKDIDK